MDFRQLDTSTLVDLLAFHMGEYLKLSQDGTKQDEYMESYLMVKALQDEIDSRKRKNRFSASNNDSHYSSSPGN